MLNWCLFYLAAGTRCHRKGPLMKWDEFMDLRGFTPSLWRGVNPGYWQMSSPGNHPQPISQEFPPGSLCALLPPHLLLLSYRTSRFQNSTFYEGFSLSYSVSSTRKEEAPQGGSIPEATGLRMGKWLPSPPLVSPDLPSEATLPHLMSELRIF